MKEQYKLILMIFLIKKVLKTRIMKIWKKITKEFKNILGCPKYWGKKIYSDLKNKKQNQTK